MSADSGDERPLFSAQGTVVLLNTMGSAAVDSTNYRAIDDTLGEYDEPYETLDPEDMDWLEPNDLSRSLRGLFIPGEHAVDSHRLLRRMAICRDVARLKAEHDIPMMQTSRVGQVVSRARDHAASHGLPEQYLADIYERIIAETCAQEDALMAELRMEFSDEDAAARQL